MNKSDKERQKYAEELKTWVTDARRAPRRRSPRRRRWWPYIDEALGMFGIVDQGARYRCFHPHPPHVLRWQLKRDVYTIPNPMEPILFAPWSKNQK